MPLPSPGILLDSIIHESSLSFCVLRAILLLKRLFLPEVCVCVEVTTGKMRPNSVQGTINKYYKIPNNNLALALILGLFLGIRQVLSFLVFHKQTQLIVIKLLLRPNSFPLYFIWAYLIMAIAVSMVLHLGVMLLATYASAI